MTIAASFTPKPAILSFAITHELLTMRLFLDSLANNNFRMKKVENSFGITGFVGSDASIHQFTNNSVARFSLAISRQEKNGEETRRVSAFINVETWRKNGSTDTFDIITKGAMLTVEGRFRPDEWTDKDGVKHSKVVLVADKVYLTPDKEETPEEEPSKPATKKGKK